MKIWIINPFDNLPLEGFRPQRYWLMAQAFADAGHDVTLFTSDFNHTTKQQRVLISGCEDPLSRGRATPRRAETGRDGVAPPLDFTVRFIPTKPYCSNVSLARILSHRAFIKSLRSTLLSCAAGPQSSLRDLRGSSGLRVSPKASPDVVITSLPLIGTASVALELKAKYGTKVVVDIMDDWPGTFYRLFPRFLRPLARLALSPLRRAAARAYREADLVTGVADRYAELALSAGAKRYRRFYHGISCAAGPQSSLRDLRESSGLRVSPKAILYLGNLGRTYDLRTAIEAVALDAELTLDIAGKGEQEESLKSFAAEKGVADRVRFHGYLDESSLSSLASRCTYGLIPMSDESCVGVPYKLADYARYGLFILSSLRGESAALLSKYNCGALYTPANPQSLLSCIADHQSSHRDLRETSLSSCPPKASLLSELDASRIYKSYVSEVEDLRHSSFIIHHS